MNTDDLYKRLQQENIHYINKKLFLTPGAIVHYENITAIVVDKEQIKNSTHENTIIIQEFGHYLAHSYYKSNDPYEVINDMEQSADIAAWNEFFPYQEVKKLINNGISTATEIANYFNVNSDYIARCLDYYYDISDGFKK